MESQIAEDGREKRDIDVSMSEPAAKKTKTAADSKTEKSSDNGDQLYAAKIVQFRKPGSDKSDNKVIHGLMEVIEGEYKGMKGFFQTSTAYIWGYSLARANLMYNLKLGDVFLVEAYKKTITAVYGATNDTQDVPLVIKKCWLGTKTEVPQNTTENVEFSAWLSDRDLSEFEFKKWINDRLPPKPFFPLQSETHVGNIVTLIRESTKCDGGVVKINSGPLKDSLVLFEREDLYVCGVSVGEADLRMLVRAGDEINVQVQFMTGRERQLKTKKYPKTEEYEINHIALIAFLGKKRPRSPDLQPRDSLDLRDTLERFGLTVDEFEEMRVHRDKPETPTPGAAPGDQSTPKPAMMNGQNPGCFIPSLMLLPPFNGVAISAFCPNMPHPSAIPPMGPSELEQLSKCAVVIARGLVVNMVKDQTGNDINVGDIIESEEDVENAIKMGRWITEALIAKMQTHLQDKVKTKLGPNFGSILSTQKKQIEAAVTALATGANNRQQQPGQINPQETQDAATRTLIEQQNLAKKLFESEAKSKMGEQQQQQQPQQPQEPRGSREKDARRFVRDMERRRPVTPEIDQQEAVEERGMSPMELTRKYVMLNRRIRAGRGDMIIFGDLRYPKEMKVNFRISNNYELTGGPKEYYTMECIYYFARNIDIDHSLYVRRALTDNLPVVRKPDREPLVAYLTGKVDGVPNLENVTFSELNPGMVLPTERERSQNPTDPLQDPISQAVSIVSEVMSKIDPEAGEMWKETKDPGNAIEQWKAKNNFGQDGASRDHQNRGQRATGGQFMRREDNRRRRRSRSLERNRGTQEPRSTEQINPFESNTANQSSLMVAQEMMMNQMNNRSQDMARFQGQPMTTGSNFNLAQRNPLISSNTRWLPEPGMNMNQAQSGINVNQGGMPGNVMPGNAALGPMFNTQPNGNSMW